eukprot:TRINITY_DN55263_c0_g1_i1.p1 TRINITY_DN55263_c0_g1~~TRINITY_DN55263_c0_g1_i1.p1  ORF type:complete len:163 (-),score=28.88 TRINITY_DN55263_c0_g1_i1:255-743(-)
MPPAQPPVTSQPNGNWAAQPAPTAQPGPWQQPVQAVVEQPVPVQAVAQPPQQQVDPQIMQMTVFIKGALSQVLQRCMANPADKRKCDDIKTKLDKMFAALDTGAVSGTVVQKLKTVCDMSNSGDFTSATKMLGGMTKDHYGEISTWGPAVSRLMKMGQASFR